MTERPASLAHRIVAMSISAALAMVGRSHAAEPAPNVSKGTIPVLVRSEERLSSRPEAEQRRKDDALCAVCPCPIEPVAESTAWTLRRTAPHPVLSDAVMVGHRGAFRCSGVALDERTVLTARHCLPASHVRTSEEGQGDDGNLFPVAASAAHPDAGVDLALLRTRPRMNVVPAIRRRARDDAPPAGVVRYVGFGAVDAAGLRGFGRKKIMDVPAGGWGCDGARVASSGCRPGLEMVIPGSAGRDTCAGDSGGPVYELASDGASCFFRLIAVTSRRVADASAPCGSGGIYARVDAADGWITERIEKWNDADREKRP